MVPGSRFDPLTLYQPTTEPANQRLLNMFSGLLATKTSPLAISARVGQCSGMSSPRTPIKTTRARSSRDSPYRVDAHILGLATDTDDLPEDTDGLLDFWPWLGPFGSPDTPRGLPAARKRKREEEAQEQKLVRQAWKQQKHAAEMERLRMYEHDPIMLERRYEANERDVMYKEDFGFQAYLWRSLE